MISTPSASLFWKWHLSGPFSKASQTVLQPYALSKSLVPSLLNTTVLQAFM